MIKGIIAVTPTLYDDEHDLVRRCEPLLRGGVQAIQFNDQQTDMSLRLRCAQELVQLCRAYQAQLIVNNDLTTAIHSKADGVYLEKHDTTLHAARQQLGDDALLGIACNDSMRFAVQAVEHGANYVTFGAVYPSATKPDAAHAPLALIQGASLCLGVPVVAFGGINDDNIDRIVAAGADATAITSALFDTKEPEATARTLASRFAPTTTSTSEP